MAESLEKSDFFVVLNWNRSALVRNLLSKKISLSVSYKKVNHWPFALVIWSTLQRISKQWFITQQIAATADLFLKQ